MGRVRAAVVLVGQGSSPVRAVTLLIVIGSLIGAQGRAVAHNIFLDGNTFRQSPSVRKRVFVGDLETGFSVFWSSAVRLDFAAVRRTKEFFGQQADDLIGAGALTVSWRERQLEP
jgi:hypothetical protein